MASGEQALITFCVDEAYDKPGEYMAGLGIAEELEVRKVDYDKKKFFEKMEAELDAEAAKRQSELDALK